MKSRGEMNLRERIGIDCGRQLSIEDAVAWVARHEVSYLEVEADHAPNALDSPALGLSFTVNHAHLVPEGIDGFLDALPIARVGEVRLADNLGDREVHLKPGEGNIDFANLFRRLEGAGFTGHYMNNFGSPEDMLAGREVLAKIAGSA